MAYSRIGSMVLLSSLLQVSSVFAVPDQEINMNIIYQLARYPQTLTVNIESVTHDGIVNLRGEVATLSKAKGIIEVAARTTGVKALVTRNLTLPFGKPIPIADVITAKIKGGIERENLDANLICFTVHNQNVLLSQNLATKTERQRLQRMLHAIAEVKGIKPLTGVEFKSCSAHKK